MNYQEAINNVVDIIVPEIFEDTKKSFKNLIEQGFISPVTVIDNSSISTGFYGLKVHQNPNFQILLLLDILTEGYVAKYKTDEIENLWGTLSSIMNCRNIEFLRPKIDYEIYENNSTHYSYENSSNIFSMTNFKVVNLKFMAFNAITIVTENELKNLEIECEKLEIKVSEMNKNVP